MHEIRLSGHELAGLSEAVLGKCGSLRFEARGFSMYPLIRDGDTIVVRPVDAGDLGVGAIILYRSASGKPVAHRIVRFETNPGDRKNVAGAPLAAPFTGKTNLFIYGNNCTLPDSTAPEHDRERFNRLRDIFVRGDASHSRTELVKSDHVLGVVAVVERGAKIVRLDEGIWKFVGILVARFPWLAPWFAGPRELVKSIAAAVFHFMQRLRLYRALATNTVGRSVYYRVAGNNDAAELVSFYQYDQSREVADPLERMVLDLAQLEPYGAYICAFIRGRIVGCVVVRDFPSDVTHHPDWWLFGLGVRTMVRGLGLGETLVRLALETAGGRGASKVHLLVDETNRVALSLYAKMGFVRAVIPALQLKLDEEAARGNVRQIVLVNQISQGGA